jgi:hypothetical protein
MSESIKVMMYFLRYEVSPAPTNPNRETYGLGYICCWIERDSLEEADQVARQDISEEKWQILERDCGEETSPQKYEEDEESLQYYEQALIDKEVYVYHLSPRFPVYWITAKVKDKQSNELCEAYFFLCGEDIAEHEDALYEPDFWTGKNQQTALKSARKFISEEGYKVVSILQEQPCGRGDLHEDMIQFYDEAETSGSCLVFVH